MDGIVDAEVASPSWEAATPEVTVVVATYRRASYLGDLVACLEAQEGVDAEVVMVDDASADGTWTELAGLAVRTSLPLLALRLASNRGPATARHTGAARGRAPVLAFTDDDCLPTPRWLRSLLDGFVAGVDVVQGRTEAERGHGPWDRTMWVTGPTPWFETCNIAYRRSVYEAVGGFDVDDPVLNPRGGGHFGEDVDLGARVLAAGGDRRFVPGAVVRHRVEAGSYRAWLDARRRLADFPDLVQRSDVVRSALWRGVFLDRSTAAFDAAVLGVAAAGVARRRWPLLLALPWARRTWRAARGWTGGDRRAAVGLAARFAAGDAVTLAALVRGSARHRRLLL